jgi:ubiquinone/menaquinone biosynthesis C-methylase UbiE
MVRNKIDLIPRIKELYKKGANIIQFLKNESGDELNTIEDILISYDFQAGSYIKFVKENSSYHDAYTQEIAAVLNDLGKFDTLLEVGTGEATTLANVVLKLNGRPQKCMGFDISWSRINCGVQYLKEKTVDADLFVADLFNIPLPDKSVDVLFTSHSIEPNGGREKEALIELYRVTKKYLILFEPTNEFAEEAGRVRMRKNGYVQNLKDHITELGYNLVAYRALSIIANPLNPTGLYIIKKEEGSEVKTNASYCCPISKGHLTEYQDHLFSSESLISYPKIKGIPCLCQSYGILTTKHDY